MIDVFKIGVHLGMTTSGMGALNVLIRNLTHAHGLAGNLNNNLAKVRAAAVSAGAVFVGWKVLDGLWHAIENSRELNKELEKTKQLGGDFAAHLGKTRQQAMQTTLDVPTTTLSGNVRLARELGASLNHPDAAGLILSEAAKVAALTHNYTGESEENIAKNLTRTADSRGQIYSIGADGKEHVDPAKLQAEMEAGYRALVLGGGFLKSNDILQMGRQAGPEAKQQTPEAFYGAGVEAAIAMGASKLGTAEMSLFQQFMGGTMTKKVAEHLTQAGLLHPDEWHSGKSGGVVINPSVSKRFEALEKDPIAWLSTGEGAAAVRQYADKFGVSITTAIAQLFGRQTTQRLVNEAMSNGPQFARAREIYGGIPDVQSAFKEQMDHNLDMNILAVAAAWKSFTESFSEANTQPVIMILHGLTTALHTLTSLMEGHQAVVGYMTEFAAAFGGLLLLGGSIRLMSLALGPFTAALGLLAGPGVVAALGLLTGVGGFLALAAGIEALGHALPSIPKWVIDMAAGAAVGAAAGSIVPGVGTGIGAIGGAAGGLLLNQLRGPGDTSQNMDSRLRRDDNGNLTHKESFVPPGTSGQPQVQTITYVQLDGRTIAKAVSNEQAKYATMPPSGTSAFDTRMSPFGPGQQVRA
jgi:hypothetical protein